MKMPDELGARQAWHTCKWTPVRFQGASKLSGKLASTRGLHSVCQIDFKRVIVFGGTDDENALCPTNTSNLFLVVSQASQGLRQTASSLSTYSQGFSSLSTSEPRTTGQGPCERYGHAACLVQTLEQRMMLVIGGIHPTTRATFKDVYHLDLSPLDDADMYQALSWTRIHMHPSPRLPPMVHTHTHTHARTTHTHIHIKQLMEG